MAERFFPEVKDFAAEIAQASRMDIAQRLVNYPAAKMAELHLEEWYGQIWKFAGAAPGRY